MIPPYDRALLAIRAKMLQDQIATVMKTETDNIVHHRLAEVAAECEWCVNRYGDGDKDK